MFWTAKYISVFSLGSIKNINRSIICIRLDPIYFWTIFDNYFDSLMDVHNIEAFKIEPQLEFYDDGSG